MNKLNCFTSCFKPFIINGASRFTRCHEPVDSVLCSIVNATNIAAQIAQGSDKTSGVVQSVHPDLDPTESVYATPAHDSSLYVEVPRATRYTVAFLDDTNILRNHDYILFCSDPHCTEQRYASFTGRKFGGAGGSSELTIPAASFWVVFVTDKQYKRSLVDYAWGYFFTYTAELPYLGWNCTPPPIMSYPLHNTDGSPKTYGLSLQRSYAEHLCSDDPLKAWHGVTCQQGVVTSIDLSFLGLTGAYICIYVCICVCIYLCICVSPVSVLLSATKYIEFCRHFTESNRKTYKSSFPPA